MMTKKRLFELVGNVDGLWDDFDFRTNVPEKIGIIILDILPAVRDNEEWKWDFKFWMEKYSDDFEEIHYANNRIFLDYELEYIREILKQEETK